MEWQFSTPVGPGALTLLKASIIACLIYVPGAAFTSSSSVNALFSDVGSGKMICAFTLQDSTFD